MLQSRENDAGSVRTRTLEQIRGQSLAVSVSTQDINEGARNNAYWCPVALAIRRAAHIDDSITVAVRCDGIDLFPREQMQCLTPHRPYISAITPEAVARFVAKFDRGVEVEPFHFTLEWEAE